MTQSLFRTVAKTLAGIAALIPAVVVAQAASTVDTAKTETTWHFAVSGDSRNCGDVVVPTIAAEVKKQDAVFYWHLGDFRWIAKIDEDMKCGPAHLGGIFAIKYRRTAWQDFRENQIASFGTMPVFLGIGNHEMILHKDRKDFLREFADRLDSPVLRSQRLKDDDPDNRDPHSYYHWMDRGIDFINLDNASDDDFSVAQMNWFERLVSRDLADASVKTLVVGMHKALPYSIALSHSMNESKRGIDSGVSVYNTLLDAQSKGKHVYVLASHSHYYADNIYGTDYWRAPKRGVLPGWIIGTAGAHRYTLPDSVQPGPHAQPAVYGYLLATAHLGGSADGTVDFAFIEIHSDQVPEAVKTRFDNGFVAWCFANNRDPDYKSPECHK
jgi:hypothetical protein